MNDFQRVNDVRVEKIVDFINKIEKSARSKRASDEERAALMASALERLDIEQSASTANTGAKEVNPHHWPSMARLIDKMTLSELAGANHYIASLIQERLLSGEALIGGISN